MKKMALSTFERYEQKYLVNVPQMNALLEEIHKYMSPDPYCLDGKRYSIYNIYFDNNNNSVIQHSLSKPYFKEKLRIRSYVPIPTDKDFVYVEIKRKMAGLVTKRRTQLYYPQAKDFIINGNIPTVKKYIDKQVLQEICYFQQIYKTVPKVYIRYDRYAFFGNEDKEFRLTFDENIISRRDNVWFDGGLDGNKLIDDNSRIMEIKISGAMPLWLVHAIDRLGIRRTSFSKYGQEYKSTQKSIAFGSVQSEE